MRFDEVAEAHSYGLEDRNHESWIWRGGGGEYPCLGTWNQIFTLCRFGTKLEARSKIICLKTEG